MKLSSSLVKVPCALHQHHEVVVHIDRGGHGRVVVVPLGAGDDSISVDISKASKELKEHLVLSQLSTVDLGVHAAVVHTSEVSSLDSATAISIEFKESLINNSLSASVQLALNHTKIKLAGHKTKVETEMHNRLTCFDVSIRLYKSLKLATRIKI